MLTKSTREASGHRQRDGERPAAVRGRRRAPRSQILMFHIFDLPLSHCIYIWATENSDFIKRILGLLSRIVEGNHAAGLRTPQGAWGSGLWPCEVDAGLPDLKISIFQIFDVFSTLYLYNYTGY